MAGYGARKLQTVRITNAQGATGAGAAHEMVGDRVGIYVQTPATATVDIETSPEGVTWFKTSVVGKTANGYFPLEECHKFLRSNVTAWTAGAVTVDLVQQV